MFKNRLRSLLYLCSAHIQMYFTINGIEIQTTSKYIKAASNRLIYETLTHIFHFIKGIR